MIRASTRLFAVLGDPVAHSLSPRIHNPAFEEAGVDGVYVALRCDRNGLEGLVRGLAGAGGGGNVTLPHKEAVARIVDHPSETVRLTGACNTFWREGDRIRGDNTDVAGFRGAVREVLGASPRGGSVLLMGAGGAGRAAVVGLIAEEVDRIVIFNRSPERARRLASELGAGRAEVIEALTDVREARFDLVVNATSLGLSRGDALPVDLDRIVAPAAVLDLVYRPDETEWVHAARSLGIPAADGGEMLVRQGAEAFSRWWRRDPPLETMRAALRRVRRKASASPIED